MRKRDTVKITRWRSYTPTGSWIANTTYTGFWRRVGEDMEVKVELAITGAPTAANLTINLPVGYRIDAKKLPAAGTRNTFGTVAIDDNGARAWIGIVSFNDSDKVIIMHADISNGSVVSDTSPFVWAAGDSLGCFFNVPIEGW